MVDWSKNLPSELLEKIASQLEFYADYIRLRLVCTAWRSILPKKPKQFLRSQLPCLLFPSDEKSQNHSVGVFSMFMGLEGHVYDLELLGIQDYLWRGFSKGWLVTVGRGPSIELVNPLTKARIQLLSICSFPQVLEYMPERVGAEFLVRFRYNFDSYRDLLVNLEGMDFFVQKVVLSSPPDGNNCIAMAIYGDCSKLAYCRVGDKDWKFVQVDSSIRDVIHYDGNFYCVTHDGKVLVVYGRDFDTKDDSSPKAEVLAPTPQGFCYWCKLYIVESSGKLLMVNRRQTSNRRRYQTDKFKIWTLNMNLNSRTFTKAKWIQLKNLGADRILFLGYNESVSLSTSTSCKGNRIYFTDDDHERQQIDKMTGSDIGIYNVMDGSFLQLPFQFLRKGRRTRIWPPPIWMVS